MICATTQKYWFHYTFWVKVMCTYCVHVESRSLESELMRNNYLRSLQGHARKEQERSSQDWLYHHLRPDWPSNPVNVQRILGQCWFKPQFYRQLVYKPHFETWILLFRPFWQLRVKKKLSISEQILRVTTKIKIASVEERVAL